MYLSEYEKTILPRAKEKNSKIVEELRSADNFDIYLTGHIDFETVGMFYQITKELESKGLSVYHPAMVVLPPKEKGVFEFEIEKKAKVLLVITHTVSFGTSVDVGFFTHRKLIGEDVKIVYCFTGPPYEYEELRRHPSSIYIDYFTDNINDAINKVLEFFGKKED
ncbi:hypothetical protein Py04_0055 [Pyrococcus sp. ST04]|nr:hypothetical protein Py04_0055 [Pyrococcus sp. ST04]